MGFENETNESLERIKNAAILFQGKTFVGANHFLALIEVLKEFPDWEKSDEEPMEGFITSTDRFVSREEATVIAKASGQHKDSEDGEFFNSDQLP